MGIKLIVLVACTIAGDTVSSHADIGDVVELGDKNEASTLVRMGRALYLDKSDDFSKGLHTATEDDLARIKRAAAGAKAAAKQASAPALDVASMVANAVEQAIASGLAAGLQLAQSPATPAPAPAAKG